ncbi:MAG TPA: ATP-dependent Clp protease proteolytic subunit [Candidatus Brocadiia bacterium]|nr:ATP-dependent Clp protease proteolytic subunit [Candidatus Brocadiia bacterium]
MPEPEITFSEEEKQPKKREDEFAMRLLKTRTILLAETVTKKLAEKCVSQLLLLEQDDADKEVKFFINSPGGDVDAGYAIFDMMRFVQPPICTIAGGLCASAAVVIFLAAKKERRFSLPNSRFLLHQPSTGVSGSASDVEIEAQEILKIRQKINKLIADETGQPIAKVEKDTARNFWMGAEESQKYGLLSRVIISRSELGND